MRLIIVFSKQGSARFVSHLDLQRLWQRTFKIAGFRLAMSQGYNPHPKIRFALPLATGFESQGELLECIVLDAPEANVIDKLNGVLPQGLDVLSCEVAADELPKLTALVDGLSYQVKLSECPRSEIGDQILQEQPLVNIKEKVYDLNKFLLRWQLVENRLDLLIKVENQITVRPELAAAHMFPSVKAVRVIRTGIHTLFSGQRPKGLNALDC